MPNRILRDWTDSLAIDALSAEAERFFVRLIQKADDFGRYHADTRLLASTLFPLKTDLRPSTVSQWLDECQATGILTAYTCPKGRKYLQINNFNQRTRLKQSKFPAPDSQPPTNDRQTTDKRPLEAEAEAETLFGDGGGERDDAPPPAAPNPPPPPPPFSDQETNAIGYPRIFPAILRAPHFRDAWHLWQDALKQAKIPPIQSIQAAAHLAMLAKLGPVHAALTVQLSAANAWKNFFPDKISEHQIRRAAAELNGHPSTQTPAPLPEPPGWQDIWSHHYDLPRPDTWATLPPYVQENLSAKLKEPAHT